MTDYQKENLSKGHKITPENAAEMQRRGAEARKQNSTIREALRYALTHTTIRNKKTGENVTMQEATVIQIANGMAKGDKEMLSIGLRVLGEFSEKREISGPDGEPLFTGFKDVLPQVDNIEQIIAAQEDARNKED